MITPYLHDWVFAHAAATPDAPAVASRTARLSYRELADRTRALAARLLADGVRPGERVLVSLPNTPAAVVASLAIQLIGATPVEVSRELGPEVLGAILGSLQIRLMFVAARDVPKWEQILGARTNGVVWVVRPAAREEAAEGHGTRSLGEDGRVESTGNVAPERPPFELPPPGTVDRSSAAVVLLTSGSTGIPHAVAQTYGNIDANTRSIVSYLGLTRADRALLTMPLSYCYGRSVLQTHLFVGGSVYFDDRFAFPSVVLNAMATEACTGFPGVPLTFELLRRQVDVASLRFPHLRYVTQAGGPMSPDTIEWVRAAFRPAPLYVMYGQTEATARLSYLPPERATDKAGSIGVAIPGVELRIADENGVELPPGEVGHLVARGDNVTAGYLDDSEATDEILHDGWLWTGDLALRDEDGFFFIRGRIKDILKVGGHRVSPGEIEQVIARHPAVAETAVAGLPDDLSGEVPVAFVVLRGEAAASEAELREFCQAQLPLYAVPVRWVFVETLGRGATGKLQRGDLVARHLDGGGASGRVRG